MIITLPHIHVHTTQVVMSDHFYPRVTKPGHANVYVYMLTLRLIQLTHSDEDNLHTLTSCPYTQQKYVYNSVFNNDNKKQNIHKPCALISQVLNNLMKC